MLRSNFEPLSGSRLPATDALERLRLHQYNKDGEKVNACGELEGFTSCQLSASSKWEFEPVEVDEDLCFPEIGWCDHHHHHHHHHHHMDESTASTTSSSTGESSYSDDDELANLVFLGLQDNTLSTSSKNGCKRRDASTGSNGGLLRSKRLVSSLYNLRPDAQEYNAANHVQRRRTMIT